MFFSFWSAKGGIGCTVTAACFAQVLAKTTPQGVLIVDCGGDVATVFAANCDRPGLGEWLHSAGEPEALARIEQQVAQNLWLIRSGELHADQVAETQIDVLCDVLRYESRDVVVDVGCLSCVAGAEPPPFLSRLVEAADRSVLVSNSCYLTLMRGRALDFDIDAIAFIRERGRALGAIDAQNILGSEIATVIERDQRIFQCVDSGLLAARLPRSFAKSLLRLVP